MTGGSATPRRAVFVVGMHRSGTSLVSRLLSLYGFALPNTLMPAGPHNEQGYFESQRIFEAHQELFRELGSEWDDLKDPPRSFYEGLGESPWPARFQELVLDEFGSSGDFVLKDPRISRLLPLWRRVMDHLSIEPLFVTMVRDPEEVAASLRAAQGTPVIRGTLLWLRHQLSAERETRGRPRVFVHYDRLTADWRTEMERVIATLGLSNTISEEGVARADRFVDRDLKHQQRSGKLGEVRSRGWIASVYRHLCEATEADPSDPLYATASEWFDDVTAELDFAEAAYSELSDSKRAEWPRAQPERDRANRELADLREVHEDAKREAADLEGRLAVEERRARERASEVRELRAEIEERENRLRRQLDTITRSERAMGELVDRMEDREAETRRLERELASERSDLAHALERLEAAESALEGERRNVLERDLHRRVLRRKLAMAERPWTTRAAAWAGLSEKDEEAQ